MIGSLLVAMRMLSALTSQLATVTVRGAGERGAALDDGDALVSVAGHLGGVVEVTDQVVALIAQIGPVQVRGRNTLGAVRLGAGLRRPQQRLGWDAGPVGAFTADQVPLLADPRRVGEGVRRCSSRASKPATPIRRRRGHRLAPAAVHRGGA